MRSRAVGVLTGGGQLRPLGQWRTKWLLLAGQWQTEQIGANVVKRSSIQGRSSGMLKQTRL